MSIESILERLAVAAEKQLVLTEESIAASREMTAAYKASFGEPQTGTVESAAAPAKRGPKAKTDAAPAAEAKPAATETTVTRTLEDVRAAVGDFMKHDEEEELKLRQSWAVATLATYKTADGKPAKKAVDLQPKDYADAIAKFDAELAERNKILAQSGDNDLLG